MNGKDNFWNIQKVIKEYVKVAWLFNDDIPFEKFSYPKQIILRRIASALGAFMNIQDTHSNIIGIVDVVFGHVDNLELLEKSNVSMGNKARIIDLIGSHLKASHMKSELKDMKLDAQTRKTLFNMFLKYRVESEYLKTTFSSIIEGDYTVSVAINTCASIYNEQLLKCNEQLEELLVLLLGDTFNGEFSVQELQDNYDFPLATDEELLDWAIDNT